MLVLANPGEYRINASQVHGKLVTCPEQNILLLIFCSKYQHMSALKQVNKSRDFTDVVPITV